MPDDQSGAPGWERVLALNVDVSETGLIAITSDDPRGLLVCERSLAEALSAVPQALADLRAAGAPMLLPDAVNLP